MQPSNTRGSFVGGPGAASSYSDREQEEQKLSSSHSLPGSPRSLSSALQAAAMLRQANRNDRALLLQQQALSAVHQFPRASPNAYEVALLQQRLAMEEQIRMQYLQSSLALPIEPRTVHHTPQHSLGSLLLGGYKGGTADIRHEHRLDRPKKRRRASKVRQWEKQEPRSSSSGLNAFPLPPPTGEGRTLEVGTLASFKRKWNSIVDNAESTSFDQTSRRDYSRRAFSDAIRRNASIGKASEETEKVTSKRSVEGGEDVSSEKTEKL